jgi:hypothetical protein
MAKLEDQPSKEKGILASYLRGGEDSTAAVTVAPPEVHVSGWEEGFFLREVFASNLYQQPDLYPSKYRRLQLLH